MNGYIGNDNRETKCTKDRHGGHQFTVNGSQLPPLWQEGPCSFRTARRDNYPAAREFATARGPKHFIFPSKSSQSFETAVLNRWPRAYEIPKYFAQTTSPRWNRWIDETLVYQFSKDITFIQIFNQFYGIFFESLFWVVLVNTIQIISTKLKKTQPTLSQ